MSKVSHYAALWNFFLFIFHACLYAAPSSNATTGSDLAVGWVAEIEPRGLVIPLINVSPSIGSRLGMLCFKQFSRDAWWFEARPFNRPKSFEDLWKENFFQVPCRAGYRYILCNNDGARSGFLGTYFGYTPYALEEKGFQWNSCISTIGVEWYDRETNWHVLLDTHRVRKLTQDVLTVEKQAQATASSFVGFSEVDYQGVNLQVSRYLRHGVEGLVTASRNKILQYSRETEDPNYGSYRPKTILSLAVGGRVSLMNTLTLSAYYFLYNPVYVWSFTVRFSTAEVHLEPNRLDSKLSQPSGTLQLRYVGGCEDESVAEEIQEVSAEHHTNTPDPGTEFSSSPNGVLPQEYQFTPSDLFNDIASESGHEYNSLQDELPYISPEDEMPKTPSKRKQHKKPASQSHRRGPGKDRTSSQPRKVRSSEK